MPGMPSRETCGGSEQKMPEMMLGTMMPHCIGMMLPRVEADRRGEIGTAILAAILESGAEGMTEQQTRSFRQSLDNMLHGST